MCDPITATLIAAGTTAAGAIATKPKPPSLPKTADSNVARKKAAEAAASEDLERRRKVQAGGRQGTILAGQQVAEQQRKTLLGQ